jgi:cAMP-specific phosphodiesterase 4
MSIYKPQTATMKENNDIKLITMKMIMKCADVSNASRPYEIYKEWAIRVCEEFFKQGDVEHGLDLPVSAFMDRRITQVIREDIS